MPSSCDPLLQRLSVRFQVVVEGGDLSWPDHGASPQDIESLSHAAADTTITHLWLVFCSHTRVPFFSVATPVPLDLRSHSCVSGSQYPHLCP